MQLNEDFLHYIWRYRLLTRHDLCCTNGEELQIIYPGSINTDAGPDFSMARIRIGGQLWVGNVEIHVRSSDWWQHHHENDPQYDTVILHVVCEDDEPVLRTDGTAVPVLLLKDLIPEDMPGKYRRLLEGMNFFPCEAQIGQVDAQICRDMLKRMAEDRFREKAAELTLRMEQNHHDWNETFHWLLMKNFGFKVNAVPFELLAETLPATLLAKHRDQQFQIEALLFGQAGFLEAEFEDSYPKALQNEYNFLRKKYALVPGSRSVWKFLRMHPQNFPVLRIAQVAALISGKNNLFAAMLGAADLKAMVSLFGKLNVHPYWKEHSDFDRRCCSASVELGKRSVQMLIINTFCLMLYVYGDYMSLPVYKRRAFSVLRQLPAEQNHITKVYRNAGLELRSAWDSQAVLQLYKWGCVRQKCLHCGIGTAIITK